MCQQLRRRVFQISNSIATKKVFDVVVDYREKARAQRLTLQYAFFYGKLLTELTLYFNLKMRIFIKIRKMTKLNILRYFSYTWYNKKNSRKYRNNISWIFRIFLMIFLLILFPNSKKSLLNIFYNGVCSYVIKFISYERFFIIEAKPNIDLILFNCPVTLIVFETNLH